MNRREYHNAVPESRKLLCEIPHQNRRRRPHRRIVGGDQGNLQGAAHTVCVDKNIPKLNTPRPPTSA